MSFALISQPPSQKKRPTHAPPAVSINQPTQPQYDAIPAIQTRRRSATVSAISVWAAQIQPGSPAPLTPRYCAPCTPCTPRTPRPARSTSHRRHRSFSTSSRVSRLGSPTLISIEPSSPAQTPSPSGQPRAAVSLDLLAQGYTSFIVRLPVQSPVGTRAFVHPAKSYQDIKSIPIPPIPISPIANSQKHSRSGSFTLKSAKSLVMLSSHKSKPSSHSSHHSSKSKSSTPHARYGHLMAPGGGAGALPLAAEVQLSQMLDGGSLDANVKRVAARHAKDTGAVARKKDRGVEGGMGIEGRENRSKSSSATKTNHTGNVMGVDGKIGGGVSGIYRDGKGGMYWDEDEVWELEGLLKEGDNASPTDAKRPSPKKSGKSLKDGYFKSSKSHTQPHAHAHSHPTKNAHNPDWVPLDHHQQSHQTMNPQSVAALRRESIISSTSSGSRDSDLDMGYAVRPRDVYNDAPGMEAHMRRRADALDAFSLSGANRADGANGNAAPRERPRPRQRPAPLALALEEVPPHVVPPAHQQQSTKHHSSRSHRSSRPTHGSAHASARMPVPPLPTAPAAPGTALATEGRKDFFASSFAPAPVLAAPAAPRQAASPFPQFSPPPIPQDMSKAQGRRGSLTAFVGAMALGKAGRRASLTPSTAANYGQPYAHHHAHGTSIASASTVSLKAKSKTSNILGLFKR